MTRLVRLDKKNSGYKNSSTKFNFNKIKLKIRRPFLVNKTTGWNTGEACSNYVQASFFRFQLIGSGKNHINVCDQTGIVLQYSIISVHLLERKRSFKRASSIDGSSENE